MSMCSATNPQFPCVAGTIPLRPPRLKKTTLMPIDSALRAQPQQDRSRASLRRVLDVTRALLAEGAGEALTIAEISKRSGVSVGSIYGRFDGKDDLILATMADTITRIDQDWEMCAATLAAGGQPLRRQVPALIDALADHLSRYANVLRAFMFRADDPRIAQCGKASHLKTRHSFERILLMSRCEITHPDPEHAASACFSISYAALARFLGLGSAIEAAGEGDWAQLKDDLGQMCLGFLTRKAPC